MEKKYDIQAVNDTQIMELNVAVVRKLFCQKATELEATMFLKMCQARRMNPFLREIYLVKYSESMPASIVVGKDTFTQRADDHPQFDGFQAGIIVKGEDKVMQIEGSLVPEGFKLIGGWARIYRKDRKIPVFAEVSMREYQQLKADGTPNKMWSGKPATMIRKVALCQALREAFPKEFGGLYGQEEILPGNMPDYKDTNDERNISQRVATAKFEEQGVEEAKSEEEETQQADEDNEETKTMVDEQEETNEETEDNTQAKDIAAQFNGSVIDNESEEDDLMPKKRKKNALPDEMTERPKLGKGAIAEEHVDMSDEDRRANGYISVKQIRRMFALASGNGMDDMTLKKWLASECNIAHIWKIKRGSAYDSICAKITGDNGNDQ